MTKGTRHVANKEPRAATATADPSTQPSNPAAAKKPRQPAQPYARIQLTVEPDCFILQPYRDLTSECSTAHSPDRHTDLVRILFKAAGAEAGIDDKAQPAGSTASAGLVERQAGRVSFLSPRSYTRSEAARDYIIYGCVGLLDLHTGPHFIVITSIKALGDIEDKAIYAINKVAVLPMEPQAACEVLDRMAQWIDPLLGPVLQEEPPSEQASDLQAPTSEETPVGEQPPAELSKSPKIRFSFLGSKHDKGVQKPAFNPSLPLESGKVASGIASTSHTSASASKKLSFDIPRLNTGSKGSSSPTSSSKVNAPQSLSPMLSPSPRSTQPGFFTKLKDSVLDIKSPRTSLDVATPQRSVSGSETSSVTNVDSVAVTSQQAAEPQKEHTHAIKVGIVATEGDRNDPKDVKGEDDKDDEEAQEEEMEKNRVLDRRVIREISSIFGTGFYFSTEFNLLSSMQRRFDIARDSSQDEAPLWEQVDKRFWWNEYLLKEFLDIQAHGYILPVMQGYVEIEQCEIEEQPFEFTLISRRSRDRSGLRYQRRGIDENGNTANFVETEQLLRIVRDESDHQVSFVQTRGSIPLFWSQSPYRLKPIPVLERSEFENEVGFKKHVDDQLSRYGKQIFFNLVEQHGRELIAGSAYTRHVEKLAEPRITYVEFDFHEQCRGMKYENIERLIKSQETPILDLGYCWLAPRNAKSDQTKDESFERLYDQKGVIRTNCMDCLDRTNVVQSAIGRYILNHQLLRLGIASFPDKGLSVYEDFENVFNHVWANNGDAISREYAGTSALKGDFTRTGKRNLQGMINDATNSVARMYQNTFKDYFRQATIDYLLGASGVDVFKNLQTTTFGTVVVPPPILPPEPQVHISASAPELPALVPTEAAAEPMKSAALLPSLLPHSSVSLMSLPSHSATSSFKSMEEKTLQQETWVKIREAAIETSAEIVISPGEERWKGWTFICCSNEISTALASVSSPHSSPQQPSSTGKKFRSPRKHGSPFAISTSLNSGDRQEDGPRSTSVFYDEKVVLLTEKALYICTYDYEMEKVLEFWRLALEKMTGIDKGAYFLTAQDKTRIGQDPLENYGFAVVYRASASGETLRVNSGSVRNRRMMGPASQRMTTDLDRVQELEEDGHDAYAHHRDSRELAASSSPEGADRHDDSRSARSLARDEHQVLRSVRFKIVKHPETSVMPFVTSSSAEQLSGQSKANPSNYKRTAQDGVEWVVTEIVKARCELISVAETTGKKATLTVDAALGASEGHPGRAPSEEYNYHPPREARRSSVQVDLIIRDRILQSLETADQLEKASLKGSETKMKKQKKSFSDFFTASKTSKEQGALQSSKVEASSGGNNLSWLKKLQFGRETDSDTDYEEQIQQRARADREKEMAAIIPDSDRADALPEVTAATEEVEAAGSRSRSGSLGVFAKLKQAVKNL
ncbi:hypothetical protein BGZ70_000516 [Mortierella alpina]|uniref:SAC domain-containing protein n=1 Tax=Mortierella alpina TaxID=64518 RepID=A0A9P6JF15_MORAP|nr:hypothetical protein BGZ70_000516 [Mortierella alpina]